MSNEITDLLGKTLAKIEVNDDKTEILFTTMEGELYLMHHERDCCEDVSIDDICGDFNDLIGMPILQAEKSTNNKNPDGITKEDQDSFTWTFYRLATNKGSVVIRWYGESNGYYSEEVNFTKLGE